MVLVVGRWLLKDMVVVYDGFVAVVVIENCMTNHV